jgi:outer membrane protein insertion porin family
VRVRPGPRARIRAIEVTGNTTIPAAELTRELPVKRGDWYDGAVLERGRRLITQQELVRLALLDVPRDSFRDSSVVVTLRVRESKPHAVRGDIGLTSGSGVSAHAQWTDRSLLGGLRTFTIAAIAQSGVITVGQPPQELYRLRLTLNQPYVADRRVSFVGGPFVEYRSDLRDRSRALGVDAALVWATAPLRSISLGYSISHRRILGYGLSGDLPPVEYFPLLGLADSAAAARLGSVRNRSAVSLEGTYGRLDQLANPRRGYVLRPRVEITTPGGFNTNEYLLLDVSGAAFLPLTRRTGVTLRAGGGRIFPYGRGLPVIGVDSPFVSMLRLRDIAFTAGGSRDVRGWGSELLGPKLPEAQRQTTGGSVQTFANWYTPVGGLARLTASAEVRMPLPGFGQDWQSFAFLDGGRIWTPDPRFAPDVAVLAADRFFVGTGLGVAYQTVVGSVQVALAYKLNPSPLDLRAPEDVLEAMAAGRPIESATASALRRFHIHLAIGATF